MTIPEALQIVDQACAVFVGTRADHQKISDAIRVIVEALAEKGKVEVERPPDRPAATE